MPLYRRLPKVGFTSRKKVIGTNVYAVISTTQLEAMEEKEITLELLRELKVIKGTGTKVKILAGKSKISKKLVVEANAVSAAAKEAIEKAGGEVKIVS